MTIGFEHKLSYLWSRVAQRDRIYSRVFEQYDRTTSEIDYRVGFSTGSIPKATIETWDTMWIEARPNKGGETYALTEHHYIEGSLPAVNRPVTPEQLDVQVWDSCTREEAVKYIQKREQQWSESGNASLADRQPFKKALKPA